MNKAKLLIVEDEAVTGMDIMNNPGMVKLIRLKIKNQAGTTYCMEGIISNLCNNPVIKGIVLSRWIHSRYPEKHDALIKTGIGL